MFLSFWLHILFTILQFHFLSKKPDNEPKSATLGNIGWFCGGCLDSIVCYLQTALLSRRLLIRGRAIYLRRVVIRKQLFDREVNIGERDA